MFMLDNTIVTVALPMIQSDLGMGISQLEWVVTGYGLTFASLLLTGGKLGDMYGRRRIFMIGLALFTVTSLLCGWAPSAEFLILARIAQGASAALMMPATLSILTATFGPEERGAALGIWTGVGAMALALGPVIGGLITEHVGWGWAFYVNVPVGVVSLLTARAVITESKDDSAEQRLDLPGLATSAFALFSLVFGLIEAGSHGWTSTRVLSLFAVAGVAGASFICVELRQRQPIFDLHLFRNPVFAGANTIGLIATFIGLGTTVFLSLYLQAVLAYGPLRAGAAFLPWMIAIVVIAPLGGRASDRLGSRWLTTVGLSLVAVGMLLLSRSQAGSSYWSLLPGMLITGVGMAITVTPNIAAAMSAVSIDKAGVSAGMLNTFRQAGGALGVAVMGAILASQSASTLANGGTPSDAFMSGFHASFRVAAAVAGIGAVVAVLTIRNHAVPQKRVSP